jgi:ArsR family transcriptional regulator
MFRAFSDRTRLRILHLLLGGELCVCDIVAVLRVPQPTASRHLAYLRHSGMVAARRAGHWMYYSLTPAESPAHKKLIECLACCFSEVSEIARDAKRLERQKRPGCC